MDDPTAPDRAPRPIPLRRRLLLCALHGCLMLGLSYIGLVALVLVIGGFRDLDRLGDTVAAATYSALILTPFFIPLVTLALLAAALFIRSGSWWKRTLIFLVPYALLLHHVLFTPGVIPAHPKWFLAGPNPPGIEVVEAGGTLEQAEQSLRASLRERSGWRAAREFAFTSERPGDPGKIVGMVVLAELDGRVIAIGWTEEPAPPADLRMLRGRDPHAPLSEILRANPGTVPRELYLLDVR